MPYRPNPEKTRNHRSSEDIRVSPIPTQTASAVAGAAIGSVAGPIGAVVGGVVGAFAGKAAGSRRKIHKAGKGVIAVAKPALKRFPTKNSRAASRKTGGPSRGESGKRKKSKRSPADQSRKRVVRGSRARHKRRSGHRKKR